MDNGIKKYVCNQCQKRVFILFLKTDKLNVGYLCEDCWKIYDKRIKEIYGIIKNK